MTHHLCRGCVPGEVVHSRGGQVVLIVLRELLELVLVVWQASVHAEVPADGRTDRWRDTQQDKCHRQHSLMRP